MFHLATEVLGCIGVISWGLPVTTQFCLPVVMWLHGGCSAGVPHFWTFVVSCSHMTMICSFFVETGVCFCFPVKSSPSWTMGLFHDCSIQLTITVFTSMTAAKKLDWSCDGPTLQLSRLTTIIARVNYGHKPRTICSFFCSSIVFRKIRDQKWKSRKHK